MCFGLGGPTDTSPPLDERGVESDVSSDASLDHRMEKSIVEANVGVGSIGDSGQCIAHLGSRQQHGRSDGQHVGVGFGVGPRP